MKLNDGADSYWIRRRDVKMQMKITDAWLDRNRTNYHSGAKMVLAASLCSLALLLVGALLYH